MPFFSTLSPILTSAAPAPWNRGDQHSKPDNASGGFLAACFPLQIISKCDAFAFRRKKYQPPMTAGHHAATMTARPRCRRGVAAALGHATPSRLAFRRPSTAPQTTAPTSAAILSAAPRRPGRSLTDQPQARAAARSSRPAPPDSSTRRNGRGNSPPPQPARDRRNGRVQHRQCDSSASITAIIERLSAGSRAKTKNLAPGEPALPSPDPSPFGR